MNRKSLIPGLLLFVAVAATLSAQMRSGLRIIGFSDHGDYLAYEINGLRAVEAKAFSVIQIVDVEANDFLTDDILLEEPTGGDKPDFESLYQRNRRRAQPYFEQFRIIEGNNGILLHEDSLYEQAASYRYNDACRSVPITLPGGAGEPGSLLIELTETVVSSSRCSQLTEVGLQPKIFTLTATGEGATQLLQEDKVLYASRRCPYGYGIYRIYALEDNLAVFLHSWTRGAKEAEILKLVVTAKIAIGVEEEQALALIGNIQFGSTPEDLQSLLPGLSALQRDAGPRLTEAHWQGRAFGLPVTGEFNFQDGALYSYYFFLRDLDVQRAGVLYNRLKTKFSHDFGAPLREMNESDQPDTTAPTTVVWRRAGHYVLVTRTDQTLAWGAQEQRPF